MHDAIIRPTRRATIGLICAALVWPRLGRAEPFEALTGKAFGTSWRIVGPSGDRLDRIRPELDALFETIDRQMSPWRRDSAVSRFNAGSSGWHRADEDVVEVTENALTLAQESDGAFDPTVGPLVARWGFGPIEGGAPNWKGLSVGNLQIAKAHADLTLDLCGIAKGWALDRAADVAKSAGLETLLLDLGGELVALGHHPSGRSWRVAVQHPTRGEPSPAVLQLPPGRAVATSGLQTQSYDLDGRTYGHIIDPAAQSPAEGVLQSVTVLSADAMTADGWATALYAAGDVGGPALAEKRGISALFLVGDGPSPRQVKTGAIEEFLL